MSYKFLFVFNALISVTAGLVFLLVPDMGLEYFQTEGRAPELFLARFFGMALLVLGLVMWFAKDIPDESAQKNLGISMLIGSLVGTVLSILGMSGIDGFGVLRVNGWIPLVVFVLGVLSYGFMLFLKPKMKE